MLQAMETQRPTVVMSEEFDKALDLIKEMRTDILLMKMALKKTGWCAWQDAGSLLGIVTLQGMKSLAKRGEVEMRIRPGTTSAYEFSTLSVVDYMKRKGLTEESINMKLNAA